MKVMLGERIVHEVHAPPLGGTGRRGRGTAMQRDMLAPTDPHSQLQSVEAIELPHTFLIHASALSSQQHPGAIETESRSRVRELVKSTPQRSLVVSGRSAIPRRSAELRQVTGPHAADRKGALHPRGQLAALCGPQTFFGGPR